MSFKYLLIWNEVKLTDMHVTNNVLIIIEYVGCFHGDSSLPVKWTSDEMTVELCVEICRPLNMTYAVLSPSQCRCNGTLPETSAQDCTSPCANAELQICGNTRSSVSIFKIGIHHYLAIYLILDSTFTDDIQIAYV
jgi:hypothetical protein